MDFRRLLPEIRWQSCLSPVPPGSRNPVPRGLSPGLSPATCGTLVFAGLMKLRQIADALGCLLAGDGELEIVGVAGLEQASAGHLTFLANPKYAPKVKHTKASAILVGQKGE